MTKLHLTIIKVSIGSFLAFWIMRSISLRDMYHVFKNASFSSVAICLLFSLALFSTWLEGFRWYKSFSKQTSRDLPSVWQLTLFNLEGGFVGLFMPSSIGCDLYKISQVRKSFKNLTGAIGNVLAIRIFSIVSLGPLSLFALLLKSSQLEKNLISFGTALLLSGGLLFLMCFRKTEIELPQYFPAVLKKIWEVIIHVIRFASKDRSTVFVIVVASIVYHLSVAGMAFFCASPFISGMSFLDFLAVFASISMVSLMPLSVNSFGTQEAAYIWFLQPFIGAPEQALSASLTWQAMKILIALSGGVSLIFTKLVYSKNTSTI